MNDSLDDIFLPRAARVRRQVGLGESVYENLLHGLMSLQIAPGVRMNINTLARELGVSQTPIREALARLEDQGLVVKTHNVGFSAAPQINVEKFEEIYDLRLLLEPEGAARAAERMEPQDVDAIFELAARMEGNGPQDARGSYSRFATIDAEFHNRILQHCGNSLIYDTLTRLHIHMHLFRLHYHAKVTTSAVGEHRTLVEALAARDAGKARVAMRHHIELSRERFIVTFSEQPTVR